jgi:2-hydroxycyclohexanecarboxyl-CoA dehydrogenase
METTMLIKRFENKAFVVTGGAMGIGRATVERLAQEGAHVVLVDINQAASEKAMASMAGLTGLIEYRYADLSQEESIAHVCHEIESACSALHGLVNSCGIYMPGNVTETLGKVWDLQIAINLKAPALLAAYLTPLLKAGPGHIVNVSSEGAFRPYGGRWVYDATKQGVRSLTRALACELAAFGIRANTVAPGWTVTEMHFNKASDPAARKKEMEEMPYDGAVIKRLARPEEIAAVICFLLSDDASYITASTLNVDGGRVAY